MGMKVAAGLRMNEADDTFVAWKGERSIRFIERFVPVGIEKPVIVGILMVVASNLLLLRSFWICLNVRMQQPSSIAHILDCCSGAVSNLEWTVFAHLRALEICLEQGAHLSISRTTVLQHQEMDPK